MVKNLLNNPEISISPLVEFVFASERKKASIIRDQKNPSDFIVARYRSARSAFSRYFINGFDKDTLISVIEKLQSKTIGTDWAKNDRLNSIVALRHFLQLEFPFENLKCTFIKPEHKSYSLEGVDVIVSPDLILKWDANGKTNVGAIKFNIKKQSLTLQKGGLTASVIYDYMLQIASPDWNVSKEYCFCLDVMSERLFSPSMVEENITVAKEACLEIKKLWTQAS